MNPQLRNKIKKRLRNYCLNISTETIFINMENSKTNKPHKVALNLQQRLDLRSSNKHIALQNLFIYYRWKNTRKQYNHNKLKIIAPTWNGECEVPGGFYSMSDTQDYIKRIIKKHGKLAIIPPIHVYISRVNKRLVFETKGGYNLGLQTPETLQIFGSTTKLIDKIKNGENVPSFEVFEVVLIQCNLVDK